MTKWSEVLVFLSQNNNAGTFVSFSNGDKNESGYSSSSTISKFGDNYLLINFPNKDAFKKHELYLKKNDSCFLSIINIKKSPSILVNDLEMITNLECKFIEFKEEELLIEIKRILLNNIPAQR